MQALCGDSNYFLSDLELKVLCLCREVSVVIVMHNLDEDSMKYSSHAHAAGQAESVWVAIQTRTGEQRVRSHFERLQLVEVEPSGEQSSGDADRSDISRRVAVEIVEDFDIDAIKQSAIGKSKVSSDINRRVASQPECLDRNETASAKHTALSDISAHVEPQVGEDEFSIEAQIAQWEAEGKATKKKYFSQWEAETKATKNNLSSASSNNSDE